MMKQILTVYYSLPGQTFAPGGKVVNLKTGHTAAAAAFIQKAVGGDLAALETAEPYPEDHWAMIQAAKGEFDQGLRRALKAYPDISGYDSVFVGFPNWFGTLPLPVAGFLERCDWRGKTIIPFVTSGGSGLGRSLEDLKRLCPGAVIAAPGVFLGHEVEGAEAQIAAWARQALDPTSGRP